MCKSITNTTSIYSFTFFTTLVLFILIMPSKAVCPGSAPYLLPSTNQCYAICPWEAPNKYYAYSSNNTCLATCPGLYYAFDGNKSCTLTCPLAPNLTFFDTVNKTCVSVCPANYFGYLGNVAASNQFCVQSIFFFII